MKKDGLLETTIRLIIRKVAKALNYISGGKITPNFITIFSLLAYILIAYGIAQGQFVISGFGVLFFGLFDTLDGELARLQKSSSQKGMFLDSVTDRMKEALIYVGLAFYWSNYLVRPINQPLYGENTVNIIPLLVIALGLSLIVSYLNAWGDVVTSQANKKSSKVNSAFRGGLAPYQVRITLLGLGLMFHDFIAVALVIISALSLLTIIIRFANVWRALE